MRIGYFRVLLICLVFLTLNITPPITNADPNGSAATRCSDSPAPYPFSGLYLCDMFNIKCAAVSSVFTWYADDSSVDAGYERARVLFAPIGWRDNHTYQEERPSTYDSLSVQPPLHMVLLWNQIHRAHHSAIAYTKYGGPSDWISVTQFEYLPQQIDHNGIPNPGAHPIHIRQWALKAENVNGFDAPDDPLERLASLYPWLEHQGEIVDSAGNGPFSQRFPLVSVPQVKQFPQQRWSCQGYFR